MQSYDVTKKLLLIVMDGVGVAKASSGNGITLAHPQNLIRLWNAYPHSYLYAASEKVGLSPNTNGNSEVGHLNLGAGQVIYQNLPRINKNIENGNFYSNAVLQQMLDFVLGNQSSFHIMALASDGSVHSHIDHIIATLEFIKRKSPSPIKLFLHLFTDGRDAPPKSAQIYLDKINAKL